MAKFPETITNEEVTQLPALEFPGRMVVVDKLQMVNQACDDLLSHKIIGFDTETRPSFKAGKVNKVALLQLSTFECCYLFRLCTMRLDKAIIKVLESQDVTKVGVAIRDDLKALQKLRHFQPRGFVDLQSIVGDYGIKELSLRKLAAVVLDGRISKAQRLSNWEAAELTQAQKLYAATDAWVSVDIYEHLHEL